MFSESNSCYRNLDKLQQGGASRLFGDSTIESEGIKRPYVLGLMWHLLGFTLLRAGYSAHRSDLKVTKHKCH